MFRAGWFARWKRFWSGLSANSPRPPHRSARGRLLAVEELGPRWIPDAASPFPSALPLALNAGPQAGVIAPTPDYFDFVVTEPGRLVAEVTPSGGPARLTLLAADGTVLMQSDGSSPTDLTGRIDLHLAGAAAGTTYYLGVQGLGAAGTYTIQADFATTTPPFTPIQLNGLLWGHPCDLNGDGVTDLAAANFDGNEAFVLIGRGDGTFAPPATYTVGREANDIIAADLNGDRVPDLVSANFDGTLSILLGRGGGTFDEQISLPLGVNPSSLAAGDFDGDGRTDLAVSDYGTDRVYVLLGRGGGSFADPVAYTVGSGPYTMIAGDFAGDGRTDLVVANYNDKSVTVLAGGPAGTFRVAATVAVGDGPYGITTGDFDGDGRLDFATANYTTNDISVVMARGGDQFDVKTVAVGLNPYGLAAGDFDEDGLTDLATTNFGDGTVSVLAGRGDGTFSPQTTFTVGPSAALLVAADFDRDGRIDLANGDYAGHVSVHLGLGDGTFQVTRQTAAGGGSYDAASGDFDGDGRADVAVANYNTGDIQIFLGRQDGTFRVGGRFSTGSDPQRVTAADLNGDGDLDLVSSNYSTANVSVLLGRGDGTFGEPTFFATGNIPSRAVVRDFNADGRPDLAVPNNGGNTVSILLGRGDGRFAEPLDFAAGDGPDSLTTGDFTGDGVLDLVVANATSGDLSVLAGRGDGTFGAEARLGSGVGLWSVVAADFNRDGVLDLATDATGGGVAVFLGSAGGGFGPRVDVPTGFDVSDLMLADFDRDGRPDLAAVSASANQLEVFYGRGDGTFRAGGPIETGDTPWVGVLADFNGDGWADVVADNFASSDLSVYLNRGDGTFGRQLRTPVLGGPAAVAYGDVNNDGSPDLVAADNAAGTVSVHLATGDGTFADPVAYTVGTGPSAVTLTDGNRDGRLDIVVANSVDGTVSVLRGIGDGTFGSVATLPVGSSPAGVAAADLNGDGLTDVVVANSGSGDVSVLLGRPNAPPTEMRFAVGEGPSAVAVAHVNRDGIPDVIVTNSLSRDVSVLIGRGDGTFLGMTAVPLGVAPVGLAVGDFDGDGTPDLVTANPGDGSVTVLLGRGDGTFGLPARISVGTAPVSVTAGDFDGDGTPDLAVADSNDNSVTVLLGRGDGTFQVSEPVAAGSYPLAILAADLNRDGRLDLATANALGTPTTVMMGLGTGAFTAPGAALPPVQAPPLVADFNRDGIPDAVSLRKDGVILFRPGRTGGSTALGSPVVLNPDSADAALTLTTGRGLGTTVLVAVNARTNRIALYAWAGDRFARIFTWDLGTAIPSAVLTGDVNGDGLDDLVAGSAATGDIFISLQRPNENLSDRPWDHHLSVAPGFSAITLADVDRDGLHDLVVAEPLSGTVAVLLNGAVAPFASQLRFRAGNGLAAVGADGQLRSLDEPSVVVAGSFDADAIPDLAVLNRGTQQVAILHGDGHGGVFDPVASEALRTGADPVALVSGDFNRDGRPDLAVLNRGSEDVSVFLADGRGGFTEQLSTELDGRTARPGTGANPTGLSTADLNADGVPDLIIGDPEGDALTLLGNGDGTFRPYARLDARVTLAVTDQHGDGTYEVAIADRASDRVTVRDDDGTRAFGQGRGDGVLAPQAVEFADLNGDGIAELIVTNGGGNSVYVYPGAGEAAFGAALRFFVGTNPGGITVADIDDDGIPDLVIANEGSNDISTLLGRGTGADWTLTPGPRLRAGAGPTGTAVADVTGDGIPDILVANGGSNAVHLLPGVGGGFFDDRQPVVFDTGDRPVQLFVGNFDTTPGIDLVTVNAGSNDLTLFPGLGAGRAVATPGSRPVQALAGDFTGAGTLGLIVASEDGEFSLLEGSPDGLAVTRVFSSGFARVSDVGLGFVGGGSVEIYVVEHGMDEAVPMTIFLASPYVGPDVPVDGTDVPVSPPPPDGGPATVDGPDTVDGPTIGAGPGPAFVQVTEFSSTPGAPLELLATLVPRVSPSGDGSAWFGHGDASEAAVGLVWFGHGDASEAAVGLVPGWDPGDEAWDVADAEPGSGEVVTIDADAVSLNSFVTGAAEAPLQEYLDRRPDAEEQPEVPFPSPLELFDGSGPPPSAEHTPAGAGGGDHGPAGPEPPDGRTPLRKLFDGSGPPPSAEHTPAGAGGGDHGPTGPEPPDGETPPPEPPARHEEAPPGGDEEGASPEAVAGGLFSPATLRAVVLYPALAYVVLGPSGRRRPAPALPSPDVRAGEGDRHEGDRQHAPS